MSTTSQDEEQHNWFIRNKNYTDEFLSLHAHDLLITLYEKKNPKISINTVKELIKNVQELINTCEASESFKPIPKGAKNIVKNNQSPSSSKRTKDFEDKSKQKQENPNILGAPKYDRSLREDAEINTIVTLINSIRTTLMNMIRHYEFINKEYIDDVKYNSALKGILPIDIINYYFRVLMLFSNYYTQTKNDNILSGIKRVTNKKGVTKDFEEKEAKSRTCNITSLSMCLNALGIENNDFLEDRKNDLARIYLSIKERNTYGKLIDKQDIKATDDPWDYNYDEELEEAIEKAKDILFNSRKTRMRMPDLLQYVCILYQMDLLMDGVKHPLIDFVPTPCGYYIYSGTLTEDYKKGTFSKKVDIAKELMSPMISTEAYIFTDLPTYFGAVRIGLNLPAPFYDSCYTHAKHDAYFRIEEKEFKLAQEEDFIQFIEEQNKFLHEEYKDIMTNYQIKTIDRFKKEVGKINKIKKYRRKFKKKMKNNEIFRLKVKLVEIYSGFFNESQMKEFNDLLKLIKEKKKKYKANHAKYHQEEIQNIIVPFINAGCQVVVNRSGHYVRLENVEDNGISFDDPWFVKNSVISLGKSTYLDWKKSSQNGFFKAFHLLCRKDEFDLVIKSWNIQMKLLFSGENEEKDPLLIPMISNYLVKPD